MKHNVLDEVKNQYVLVIVNLNNLDSLLNFDMNKV